MLQVLATVYVSIQLLFFGIIMTGYILSAHDTSDEFWEDVADFSPLRLAPSIVLFAGAYAGFSLTRMLDKNAQ